MTQTLLERAWTWLHQTFPERQIYIRSDGRVQFFTFGPSLQATLAGLVLIFLGWVAFATVNVVFKDRIIAAKDHRYQQMQSAYENRVADLQISYDELNGALVAAEDHFKATADALSTKQTAIASFLDRENQVQASLGAIHHASVTGPAPLLTPSHDSGMASDSLGVTMPQALAPQDAPAAGGSSTLSMMPEPPAPQPRTRKPLKASLLDRTWTRFASLFLPKAKEPAISAAAYEQHPALRVLAAQTDRIARLGTNETRLMMRTEGALKQGVGDLREVVRESGLNPDSFIGRATRGEGGPDIPLDQVHVAGSDDDGFTGAYLRASAVLNQFNGLSEAVDHVPLAMPVDGGRFDVSSGFGARVDPFNGHYAFHPGIDFAGPWGADVRATAPGVVVFAGYRGSYGNMVEIDHGFGLHTRYGHLSAVTVSPGTHVEKGAPVGRLGSTGRSTGPHVHYEIWYDNVVRNPSSFIEAGHHVL